MSGAAPAVRVELLGPDDGPPMGAFAHALRTGQGTPLRFLETPPTDAAAWTARIERASASAPRVPTELAEALAIRQRILGAGARAEAGARALAGRSAVAVVTGQQAGLLGGPLLTFHKAAGALALARRLSALRGHTVVPVFWLAAEDHDFDEANRALVIDRGGEARALRLAHDADGRSLNHVAVPAETSDAFCEMLAAALPDTARAREVLAQTARAPDEDLATWAARCLVAVFGDSGLVILEPHVLTPWVGASYAWLLDHAEPIRAAIRTSGEALTAAGLPAPLAQLEDDATPLFYRHEVDGPRLRIGVDGQQVTLRGEPAGFDRAALHAKLEADPAHGSGNVVGRVFVQNMHLPVVAYVAGPTEIAYLAQVRAAHAAVGVSFPLALPRPEATWIDAKTSAALAAFGASPGAALRGEEPEPVRDEALEVTLAAVEARLADLEATTESLRARGGSGRAALERASARVRQAWAKALPTVRAAFERDAGVGRARLVRAFALLRPHGRGQDRLLSPWSLAARHGLAPIRAGLENLDPLTPAHHLVHLEDDPSTEEPDA
ncbi:MAG: bacillithiol biosynthesis cysteine-adding enzyme BshC [Planctomycetota bacterium]|nr:bacillithiol biosynthesis cysteine-adding enzyme BshC [Planctomycetota bacterium]